MSLFESKIQTLRRASVARLGKRFVCWCIDLLVVLLISSLLFSVFQLIVRAQPGFVAAEKTVEEEVRYYNEYAIDTHVVEFLDPENGVRKSFDMVAFDNMKRAICLSYKVFGSEQQPDFTFESDHEVTTSGVATQTTDNIAYFYTKYVPENTDKQIVNMGDKTPSDYVVQVYRNAFGANYDVMFAENRELSELPILKTQSAYYLFYYQYVDHTDTIGQTAKEYYSVFINAYKYMLEEAEKLLVRSEPYFSTHYKSYRDAYELQGRYVNYALLLALVLGYWLGVALPKLLFKDEVTVGRKILGLGVINDDGSPTSGAKSAIKSVFGCFAFLFTAVLSYMLPPFKGVYDMMLVPLVANGTLSLAVVIIIPSVLTVISCAFMLFTYGKKSLMNVFGKDKVVDMNYLDEDESDEGF